MNKTAAGHRRFRCDRLRLRSAASKRLFTLTFLSGSCGVDRAIHTRPDSHPAFFLLGRISRCRCESSSARAARARRFAMRARKKAHIRSCVTIGIMHTRSPTARTIIQSRVFMKAPRLIRFSLSHTRAKRRRISIIDFRAAGIFRRNDLREQPMARSLARRVRVRGISPRKRVDKKRRGNTAVSHSLARASPLYRAV